MKSDRASNTASYMALFRALESTRSQEQRLFFDGFASTYLTFRLRVLVALSRFSWLRRLLEEIIDRKWPGARTSGIARTRWIDDAVVAALENGAKQVAILGAGFDSRAYRIPAMSAVRVFEVDHPATSERKVRLTKTVLGDAALKVRFVQIDFNTQSLEDVLQEVGYERSLRTVFVWEGVSNYLTANAVDSTLRFCSRAAPGSEIVFTYIDQAVLDNPAFFPGTAGLHKLLSEVGERWTFGLKPAELSSYLEERGLSLVSDLGASEYRKLYFRAEALTMFGYEFYRVAVARVPGPMRDEPRR